MWNNKKKVMSELKEEGEEERDLSDFLSEFEGASGVYFITPEFNVDRNEKILVKVGLSRAKLEFGTQKKYGGLGRRLDSYLLCYPRGFFIYAVLQTQGQYAFKLENWFHTYFSSKNFKAEYRHSRVEEWYSLSANEIYATLAGLMRSDMKGFITKHSIYEPALFLDTNGRSAQYPKKSMSVEDKSRFETFLSPGKIPETAKPNRNRQNRDKDDDMEEDEIPLRSLDFTTED